MTEHDFQHTMILIIGGAGGALGTFLLQKYGLSAVIASCLVGLTGALIEHLVKLPHLAPVVFTGSFAGMTGLAIGTWPLIATAGCFSGFLYVVSLRVFTGFGGRLGTIAFISTVMSFCVLFLIRKMRLF